jgi:CO/xanthine dehydrogenase Mo-binding subunit
MIKETPAREGIKSECCEPEEENRSAFQVSRRGFMQLLGAGLLITVTEELSFGESRATPSRRVGTVGARLHIGRDGTITVMTGKVEVGQGSRAQLTQAAAEELHVSVGQIHLVMGDTGICPDDGVTAGSRTTPSTVPAVRRGAAAARELLAEMACERWKVDRGSVKVEEGSVVHPATKRKVTYAELAAAEDIAELYEKNVPRNVELMTVSEWKILGTSIPRPNRRDLVTGAHRFPSDIVRPNMLYGKVLRPPSYGATLSSIDLSEAKTMEGVVVVRDGEFVGCAAPTSFRAAQAVEVLAKTASWKTAPHPSSKEIFSYLKDRARSGRGGGGRSGAAADVPAEGKKVLREVYEISYVQHVPMEPRAAVAEWNDGSVTVWTGSQAPFGVHSQLARTFGIDSQQVRVIMPDTGGGFGGKHSGEVAVEAARLAKAAGRPVSLRWTREEEFTWAYFRPAGVIEIEAELDAKGSIASWDFTNINSGGAAIDSPYEIPGKRSQYLRSDPPLRQGSYRCLAATANNFARESFMDELAAAAGADPLAFRLAHIRNPRLRAVLEMAAKRFHYSERKESSDPNVGVGLACGTEKGSYVAACVEVRVDRKRGIIEVLRISEVFECGAIQNPDNLRSQVEGCIIMGLGGALTEEIRFENGKMLTKSFRDYKVPRFADVPELDIHLLNRPDLESAGGGETPIIAVAPAIANAVHRITGVRIRSMPIRDEAIKQA